MRLGINVPDELLRRVKEIRPRVNVSQVCRQALERYVDIAEQAKRRQRPIMWMSTWTDWPDS